MSVLFVDSQTKTTTAGVRVGGIDAPENAQAFGNVAWEQLARLALGKGVALAVPAQQTNTTADWLTLEVEEGQHNTRNARIIIVAVPRCNRASGSGVERLTWNPATRRLRKSGQPERWPA